MSEMGQHTAFVNGHRGEDGSAVAAPVVKPFVIPHAWPVSGQVQSAPDAGDGGFRQRVRSGFRVIFARRGWLAAVPVVLVNSVAFGAQLGFWRAHVPLPAGAVVVALALESIAVYLAWQAHLAQLADDAALRLRFSAYGMALVIGALNYSHFDGPGWGPTVPAVTFGMMSAISPWLWSVHSRRVSRDALKEKGLIEPHAVRLGGTRWAWHPYRSVRVMWLATWEGVNDPAEAIALLSPAASVDAAPVLPPAHAPAPAAASPAASKRTPKRASKRMPVRASAAAKATAAIEGNPGMDDAGVMKLTGVSRATVTRARRDLAKAAPSGGEGN